jgi:murein DD-endopeptidase MepM/ murein hydrolase activator NlpD
VRAIAAVLLALSLALTGSTVRAGELALEGDFVQGGLVFGQAQPGAETGRFIFGFGRDAPPNAVLEVIWLDGRVEMRHLVVAKREYKIQHIDGLPPEMVTPPEGVLARIRAENARIAAARAVDRVEPLFESGFVWPVIGPITGVFGSQRVLNGEPRRPHYGIDIGAPEGTPVKAPADGVVAIAQHDMYYTGGTVLIDHGHGLTSVYSHLKEVWVEEGARLHQGDPLGSVGATGRATGVHLDWRINWFDQRLDPGLLAPPMPAPGAE